MRHRHWRKMPPIRAYRRSREDMRDVVLDPAWRGILPSGIIRGTHPIRYGIAEKLWQGINRGDKSHRLPRNRVCPVCNTFKMEDTSWITRYAYIPVCRRCAAKGFLASTKRELELLCERMPERRHDDYRERLRNEIKQAEKQDRFALLRYHCPPVATSDDLPTVYTCWNCNEHKEIDIERQSPGLRWIIKTGFKPVCRSCWNRGVQIRLH